METGQSLTPTQTANGDRGQELSSILTIEMLSPQQLQWVDFCVVQGLITMDDGTPRKMSTEEFARSIGVSRQTLQNWKKGIPKFWEYVAQRRELIFSQTRTAKVWNAVYLAATADRDVRAQTVWLANADKSFHMPNQTVKHEAGDSLSELLLQVRARKQNKIVEAEVVATPTNPDA